MINRRQFLRLSLFGAIAARFAPVMKWFAPKPTFTVPPLADSVFQCSPMFARLRSNKPMKFNGGSEIRCPIQFAGIGPYDPDVSHADTYGGLSREDVPKWKPLILKPRSEGMSTLVEKRYTAKQRELNKKMDQLFLYAFNKSRQTNPRLWLKS